MSRTRRRTGIERRFKDRPSATHATRTASVLA